MTAHNNPHVGKKKMPILIGSMSLADYHTARVRKLAEKRMISEDRAVDILIAVHRKTRQMAEWLSLEIGEDHDEYLLKVAQLSQGAEELPKEDSQEPRVG